jgi:hypothetical protein
MASSTLRTEERMWLRRALFSAVRRAIWRTAFFADLVLAILMILEAAPGPPKGGGKRERNA